MKNANLEAMRTLGALGIAGVHIAYLVAPTSAAQHWIGVAIISFFFTASGYAIASLLITKKEPYFPFLARRLSRIIPVYYVVIGFAVLTRPLVLEQLPVMTPLHDFESDHFWQTLVWHFSLLHGLAPYPTSYAWISSGWFVSTIFQLYILAPFVLRLLLWMPTGLRYLTTGAALIAGTLSALGRGLPVTWAPSQLGLFMAGMLLAIAPPFRIRSFDCLKPAASLSKYSYCFFLIHYPIFELELASLYPDVSAATKVAILVIFGMPTSAFAAWLLYHGIEKRFAVQNLPMLKKKLKFQSEVS